MIMSSSVETSMLYRTMGLQLLNKSHRLRVISRQCSWMILRLLVMNWSTSEVTMIQSPCFRRIPRFSHQMPRGIFIGAAISSEMTWWLSGLEDVYKTMSSIMERVHWRSAGIHFLTRRRITVHSMRTWVNYGATQLNSTLIQKPRSLLWAMRDLSELEPPKINNFLTMRLAISQAPPLWKPWFCKTMRKFYATSMAIPMMGQMCRIFGSRENN